MATNFSPCKGSYVLNQFPSNVMFGMNGFHVSASGAIQGHHGPLVTCLPYKLFENTVGKGEIAGNEQFLLFPSVFYLFGKLYANFIKLQIVICKLFLFGRVQNLLFGKGF